MSIAEQIATRFRKWSKEEETVEWFFSGFLSDIRGGKQEKERFLEVKFKDGSGIRIDNPYNPHTREVEIELGD